MAIPSTSSAQRNFAFTFLTPFPLFYLLVYLRCGACLRYITDVSRLCCRQLPTVPQLADCSVADWFSIWVNSEQNGLALETTHPPSTRHQVLIKGNVKCMAGFLLTPQCRTTDSLRPLILSESDNSYELIDTSAMSKSHCYVNDTEVKTAIMSWVTQANSIFEARWETCSYSEQYCYYTR